MMTLLELIPMIDRNCLNYLQLRVSDKISEDEEILEKLKNSKVGIINVELEDNPDVRHYGFTPDFGVGLRCYMSNKERWFSTSPIQEIDWENNKFKTMNSVYKFKFTEIDWEKLYADLQLYVDYESKNKETE